MFIKKSGLLIVGLAIAFSLMSCGKDGPLGPGFDPSANSRYITGTITDGWPWLNGTFANNAFTFGQAWSGSTYLYSADSASDYTNQINSWYIEFAGTNIGNYTNANINYDIDRSVNTRYIVLSSSLTVTTYGAVGGIIEGTFSSTNAIG